jgi:hypothetical protein
MIGVDFPHCNLLQQGLPGFAFFGFLMLLLDDKLETFSS